MTATFNIYREPGPRARRSGYGYGSFPQPKRVSTIEASSADGALREFAVQEQFRSRQVVAWAIVGTRRDPRLAVTLANGANVHLATYVAWRVES